MVKSFVYILNDIFQVFYFFSEVLEAIQYKMVNADTKKGKIPYNVSVLECEFLSTARKTFTQKLRVRNAIVSPTIWEGI